MKRSQTAPTCDEVRSRRDFCCAWWCTQVCWGAATHGCRDLCSVFVLHLMHPSPHAAAQTLKAYFTTVDWNSFSREESSRRSKLVVDKSGCCWLTSNRYVKCTSDDSLLVTSTWFVDFQAWTLLEYDSVGSTRCCPVSSHPLSHDLVTVAHFPTTSLPCVSLRLTDWRRQRESQSMETWKQSMLRRANHGTVSWRWPPRSGHKHAKSESLCVARKEPRSYWSVTYLWFQLQPLSGWVGLAERPTDHVTTKRSLFASLHSQHHFNISKLIQARESSLSIIAEMNERVSHSMFDHHAQNTSWPAYNLSQSHPAPPGADSFWGRQYMMRTHPAWLTAWHTATTSVWRLSSMVKHTMRWSDSEQEFFHVHWINHPWVDILCCHVDPQSAVTHNSSGWVLASSHNWCSRLDRA